MEVVLKRTKITGSILKQIEYFDFKDIDKYSALGWCRGVVNKKTVDYTILYNHENKDLCKLVTIKHVELTPSVGIEVVFTLPYAAKRLIQYSSEDESKFLYNHLMRIKRESSEQGQFFI